MDRKATFAAAFLYALIPIVLGVAVVGAIVLPAAAPTASPWWHLPKFGCGPAGVYRVDTEVDWLGPCPGGLYGTHPRQTQMHVGQTLDLALIGAWASGTRSSNESAVHWVSGSLDGHTSSYRAVGAGAATISAAGLYCLDDDSNLSVPDCPLLVITVAE